ncbi:MAG: response regulator [bacterium]
MAMENEKKKTIVIIEDNEGHAVLIKRNFKRKGIQHNIVHIKEGLEALDYIYCRGKYAHHLHEHPLILILDLQMPYMDGIEVLRQIKTDPTVNNIPVNIFSTRDDPHTVAMCYSLGCASYTIKPIKYNDFHQKIQELGNYMH